MQEYRLTVRGQSFYSSHRMGSRLHGFGDERLKSLGFRPIITNAIIAHGDTGVSWITDTKDMQSVVAPSIE